MSQENKLLENYWQRNCASSMVRQVSITLTKHSLRTQKTDGLFVSGILVLLVVPYILNWILYHFVTKTREQQAADDQQVSSWNSILILSQSSWSPILCQRVSMQKNQCDVFLHCCSSIPPNNFELCRFDPFLETDLSLVCNDTGETTGSLSDSSML